LLLSRIEDGECTAFLGAGACEGVLPTGSEMAREWAKEHDYPLSDVTDLVRVSQFLSVQYDPVFPRKAMIKKISEAQQPDFTKPDEPHGFLAKLPLPIIMTTNYDDFMVKALKAQGKEPVRELCRWNRKTRNQVSVFDKETGFSPTAKEPVVFHLHGNTDVPESMVLTEDDYLDFLVNVSKDVALLPARIQEALAESSLLFIGYSLSDWSFRVLFRALVSERERHSRFVSITVQLPPPSLPGDATDPPDEQKKMQEKQMKYLDEYFSDKGMRVYWGKSSEFTSELRKRWEESNASAPAGQPANN
jgi:hypothetical protein